jgi:hypothetical protein
VSLKLELYNQCQDYLKERLEVIQNSIKDLQNSLERETKSTAGDKHETGRAMLQIEREKAGQQLADIQKQFEILNRIDPEFEQNLAVLGSIVYTTKSIYFLSISAGELYVGGIKYFAISVATPIGKILVPRSKGDTVYFNGEQITITKIL